MGSRNAKVDPVDQSSVTRILLVTDHTAATPELLAAMRRRAEQGAVQFRLLVPNPARAELHLLHPDRHDKAIEAEQVLLQALPAFEEAAGGRIIASVSIRHDPYEAVEELMLSEPIDEVMLSVAPSHHGRWLHPDLAHRLLNLGRPVLSVPNGTSTST